ncbi:S1 family peptidase [Saccharomonospora iraqiensis]|uniref:S1 family peptidase n=1 Tax=Saccharomonospora iraqiensis TaxID=52698 RepID=UPI00022E82C6|nr:S1 family peptidase [Saccharomonospora iraqiensis]
MTSRKRRVAARLGTTAVLATGMAAALAIPATAGSGAPVTPAGDNDPMIQAMQRDLGVNAAQAEQRLRAEAEARGVADTVRAELGDSFGGAHFDAERDTLVVGVTDAAKADEVRAAGAEARMVDASSAELESITQRLNRAENRAPDAVTGWYVDVESNSVVVTTAPKTRGQATAFVNSTGADRSQVEVVESREQPRALMNIYGGNAYYMGSGGRCSIGFAVNGGFVTAGHCGSTGESTSQPSGTFAGSSFPYNDYAYVQTGSDDTPQPLVNMYNGYGRTVSGSNEAPVGSSICRSGSTTGWHCGTVEAKNQTVRYSQGAVYGMTRTDVCAEPGDSGGSFISGNQAQGMTSGGSGNCTWGGTTYFQPVNEALNAYGLSLVTG